MSNVWHSWTTYAALALLAFGILAAIGCVLFERRERRPVRCENEHCANAALGRGAKSPARCRFHQNVKSIPFTFGQPGQGGIAGMFGGITGPFGSQFDGTSADHGHATGPLGAMVSEPCPLSLDECDATGGAMLSGETRRLLRKLIDARPDAAGEQMPIVVTAYIVAYADRAFAGVSPQFKGALSTAQLDQIVDVVRKALADRVPA